MDDADREHASKLPSAETLAEYRVAALRELWEDASSALESLLFQGSSKFQG